jgi:hypothetical protein
MATIIITSDLHLGITSAEVLRDMATAIAAEQPVLTVLAGDIGEPLPNFENCLRVFADLPGDKAVLAGNHDVWGTAGIHSQDLWDHLLPDAARAAGMLWLENTEWRLGDLAVIGTMAWYDYSAADPSLPPMPADYYAALKRKFHPDARYIDWAWDDLQFSAILSDQLVTQMQRLQDDPTVGRIAVVTHVPLFEAQMLRKPDDPQWGSGNAFFGNLTIGARIARFPKLAAVVSGHTHVGRMGTAPRLAPSPELPPISVAVVASDYNVPAYIRLDTESMALTFS